MTKQSVYIPPHLRKNGFEISLDDIQVDYNEEEEMQTRGKAFTSADIHHFQVASYGDQKRNLSDFNYKLKVRPLWIGC